MIKYIFLSFAFWCINIVSSYGQHLKFMDVELGQNAEYFKYKLSQKGFTPGMGESQDFLFGQYLVRESRIYCRETNGIINQIFINFVKLHFLLRSAAAICRYAGGANIHCTVFIRQTAPQPP